MAPAESQIVKPRSDSGVGFTLWSVGIMKRTRKAKDCLRHIVQRPLEDTRPSKKYTPICIIAYAINATMQSSRLYTVFRTLDRKRVPLPDGVSCVWSHEAAVWWRTTDSNHGADSAPLCAHKKRVALSHQIPPKNCLSRQSKASFGDREEAGAGCSSCSTPYDLVTVFMSR